MALISMSKIPGVLAFIWFIQSNVLVTGSNLKVVGRAEFPAKVAVYVNI